MDADRCAALAAVISRRLHESGDVHWHSDAISDVVPHLPIQTVQAKGSDWAEVDQPLDTDQASYLVRLATVVNSSTSW
jgi:hypothetical protein